MNLIPIFWPCLYETNKGVPVPAWAGFSPVRCPRLAGASPCRGPERPFLMPSARLRPVEAEETKTPREQAPGLLAAIRKIYKSVVFRWNSGTNLKTLFDSTCCVFHLAGTGVEQTAGRMEQGRFLFRHGRVFPCPLSSSGRGRPLAGGKSGPS